MYFRVLDTTCSTDQWISDNFKPMKVGVIQAVMRAGASDHCIHHSSRDVAGRLTEQFDPIWGTCWIGAHSDFTEECWRAAITVGFDVYFVPALGDYGENEVVLAINGAGYSMTRAHFIPLRMAVAIVNAAKNMDFHKITQPDEEDIQNLQELQDMLNKELGLKGDVVKGLGDFMEETIGRKLEPRAVA